jgi:hypothetical protein
VLWAWRRRRSKEGGLGNCIQSTRAFWGAIAAVLLAGAVLIPGAPAEAKSYKRPIAVMKPNGNVVIIKGRPAKTFIKDALELDCVTCDDTNQAASLAEKIISKKHPPQRFLITSRGLMKDHGWTMADWFYPSKGKHGAYLVSPLGIADGSGAWDLWEKATKRMERIVRKARPVSAGATSSMFHTPSSSLVEQGGELFILVAVVTSGLIVVGLKRRLLGTRSDS